MKRKHRTTIQMARLTQTRLLEPILLESLQFQGSWAMLSTRDAIAFACAKGFRRRTAIRVLTKWLIENPDIVGPVRTSLRMIQAFGPGRTRDKLRDYITKPLPGIVTHLKIHASLSERVTKSTQM